MSDLPDTGKISLDTVRRGVDGLSTRHKDSIKLFFFLLLFFSIFAHTIGDNENTRLDTTVALVEDGTLSIDRLHENTGDKALIDGRYYSDKAPLPSLLALPGYMIVDSFFGRPVQVDSYLEEFRRSHDPKMEWGRLAATVSVSAVAGAFSSVLVFLLSLETGLSRRKSLLMSVFTGTGTLVFPYSTTFHGTMLGTFFLLAAVFTWYRHDYSPGRGHVFLVASLVGLGVSASYLIVIPGGILLSLVSLERIRDYHLHVENAAGLAAGLLPLFAFNFFTTGNPLEPTLLHIVAEGATKSQTEFTSSAVLAPVPIVAKMIRNLVSPMNGLFLYTPLMLFGVLGLRRIYSDRKLFTLVVGSFSLGLFASSIISGGPLRAFYGPRYLLPSASLLLVPLAVEFRESERLERLLLYASGAVSTVFMLGSTQPWIGTGYWKNELYGLQHGRVHGGQEVGTAGVTKFTEIAIYDNRLLSYLVNLPDRGLQSPVVSYLTGAASDFHMVLSAYPQFHFPVGGFHDLVVIYDTRFLIILLIAVSGLLLFRENLRELKYFTPKFTALLLLGLMLAGFSSSTFHMDGWYTQQQGEELKWGRETPELYFTSRTDRESLLELDLQTYREQDFQIYFNGRNTRNLTVDSDGVTITEVLELEKGLNRLEFRTDRCVIVGKLANNTDERCVTLGIRDYNFTELEEESYIFEDLTRLPGGERVVDDESGVLMRGTGQYSVEMDAIASSRTELVITGLEGEVLTHATVDRFRTEIATPYRKVEGLERFRLHSSCDNCTIKIEDIQVRKFSKQPEDLLYKPGHNWYRSVETENYTWSTDSPLMFIYNYRNQSVNKTLWIEGRSFERPRNLTYIFNGEELATKHVPEAAYRIAYKINGTPRVPEDYPVGKQLKALVERSEDSKKIRIDNKYGFRVVLEPGENVLELESDSNCVNIGEVNNNQDFRCALFGLKNLYLTR